MTSRTIHQSSLKILNRQKTQTTSASCHNGNCHRSRTRFVKGSLSKVILDNPNSNSNVKTSLAGNLFQRAVCITKPVASWKLKQKHENSMTKTQPVTWSEKIKPLMDYSETFNHDNYIFFLTNDLSAMADINQHCLKKSKNKRCHDNCLSHLVHLHKKFQSCQILQTASTSSGTSVHCLVLYVQIRGMW